MVAMLVLLAAVAALAEALRRLVHVVARDGYGLRPAPRGPEDWAGAGLPSVPYTASRW